jgi:hypothetical protein
MTFAAVTLLGMTVGQPPAPDYYPMNSRTIKLPVEYKKDRKAIRQVHLYVAHNGENTWYSEGLVTPDKDSFVYLAKDDGIYWFKMVIEDLKGNKDPADLTRDPPDLKVVIDTTPPQIRVTNARRTGQDVVIEWAVEDKFPNDAETKIYFCTTGDPAAKWQEVKRHPASPAGVGFACGTNDGVTVKIAAADVAGNRTEVTREFAAAAPPATANSSPAPAPASTTPPAPAAGGVVAAQNTVPPGGGGAIAPPPPPDLGAFTGPITPAPTPPAAVAPPAAQPLGQQPGYQPPVYQPSAYQPPAQPGGDTGGAPQPLPTVDPKAQPSGLTPQTGGAAPAGGWTGAAPAADAPRAQVIGYPRFDLGYDVEQRGPSGISRVDLWVTRDEGKSWLPWSQHDGKNGAVRVTLDAPKNPQPLEGAYGFRLVPVSGAGLKTEPAPGDAPELRVVLDVTPPKLELYKTAGDPANPDTLVIRWTATDRNFGEEPITLEWSEAIAGPWHPVASTGPDPVVQATAVSPPPVAKRLANTGQYAWRVPAGTPARVYLKATACDAAGNVTERVTRDPETVDLTKPRARISGIVPPALPRP